MVRETNQQTAERYARAVLKQLPGWAVTPPHYLTVRTVAFALLQFEKEMRARRAKRKRRK